MVDTAQNQFFDIEPSEFPLQKKTLLGIFTYSLPMTLEKHGLVYFSKMVLETGYLLNFLLSMSNGFDSDRGMLIFFLPKHISVA